MARTRRAQQVADQLGCTSRGTAYNVVAKALREQTAEAVADLRDLENARLDALQVSLWDAAMAGDVKAAVAIVQIVKARVHLEWARAGQGYLRRHASCTPNSGRASTGVT